MERPHVRVMPQVRGVDVGGGGMNTYKVLFPRILKSAECPVEKCTARENPLERLRENFMYRHWKSKVAILKEGTEPFPRCDQCGMNMPADRFLKHKQSGKSHKATERRLWRRDVDMAEMCGEMEFSLEGV